MPSWLNVINSDQFQSINGRLDQIDPDQVDTGNGLADTQNGFALLDSQSVLCIKGDGAATFLQGQCTADIEKLEVGESTLGAICTNKGRVICNFRAFKTDQSILLRISSDLAQPAREYLTKYAVFFKAELQAWGAPSVAVAMDQGSISLDNLPSNTWHTKGEADSIEFYTEPEHANELYEFLNGQSEQISESNWYALQIKSGQTSINICTTEKYLPHQLNLDKSGAVSFTKGCYTGQEIVARTEYKGKTKRRVFPVLINSELDDLHDLELREENDAGKQIDLLKIAKEPNNRAVGALLLPTDFPQKGELSVNGKQVRYEILRLPYRLAE